MTGPGPTWNVHRSSAFGFVAPGAGSWALSLWLVRQGVDVQRWPCAGQIGLLLRRTNHAGRTLALDTRAGGTLVARICGWRTGTMGNGLGAHAQARSSMLHSPNGGTCAGQTHDDLLKMLKQAGENALHSRGLKHLPESPGKPSARQSSGET